MVTDPTTVAAMAGHWASAGGRPGSTTRAPRHRRVQRTVCGSATLVRLSHHGMHRHGPGDDRARGRDTLAHAVTGRGSAAH